MRFLLLIPFLALLLFACELDKELPYLSEEQFVVVNGIITPDSLIQVQVSYSLPYPRPHNEFPQIENASVRIYEDGEYLGELAYLPEQQLYQLDAYPKAGSRYALQVAVPGHGLVEGETSIPATPQATACYAPFINMGTSFNGKIYTSIELQDIKKGEQYWLGVLSEYAEILSYNNKPPYSIYDSLNVKKKLMTSLISRSAAFDLFNTFTDKGLVHYFYYARMLEPTQNVPQLDVEFFSFETAYFHQYSVMRRLPYQLGLNIVVLNTSPEYDHFLKSTFINFLNSNFETDTPNPFAEHLITYSNIKGGKGVFAGYNQLLVPIRRNDACR